MVTGPYIYIVPMSGMDGSDIIKGILEEIQLPLLEGKFDVYKWTIDNKYYTANVKLCVIEDLTKCSIQMNNATEAVVIYFDPKQTNVLSDIDQLSSLDLDETNADVKLLVCKTYEDFSLQKEVMKWCITNGWELVQLNPIIDEVSEDTLENDFTDSCGFERIKQALNANMWTNLKLKGMETTGTETTNYKTNILENITDDFSPGSLPHFNQGDSISDLETLIRDVKYIKAKVETLSFHARRGYAADVAMRFMQAYEDSDADDEDSEPEV